MSLDLKTELVVLRKLTVKQLRIRYAEVFGETTNADNKPWLVKRIAWRLQSLEYSGLSERARQRANELANEADIRMSPPKVIPFPIDSKTVSKTSKHDDRIPAHGTVITRKYKGETLQVKVLVDGFEYDGETFSSLSAVAKAITGSHCNGFLFFKRK